MNTRELTLQYLHSLQDQGTHKLPINDEARSVLREWMLAARGRLKKASAAPPLAPIVSVEEQPVSPHRDDPLPQEARAADEDSSTGLILPSGDATRSPSYPAEITEAHFLIASGDIAERWQSFEYYLAQWSPIKKLGTLRDKLVLGQGKKDASIMFVGDAPTSHDEESGIPFAGAAGEKLNGILKAMELTREEIYLTHLLKYRPAMPRQMTNNRTPSPIEIDLFSQVLHKEIELVAPRVIIALGVIAARGLLQLGELPLAAYQSQAREHRGIPVLISHHPSYLLRTTELSERREIWEHMLRAMELAQLPISARQQGYFLEKTNRRA